MLSTTARARNVMPDDPAVTRCRRPQTPPHHLRRRTALALALAALLLAVIAPHASAAAKIALPGLTITGDRFSYDAPGGKVEGILVLPDGPGPHGALLISHGMGANAARFATDKARTFRTWGLVCIAPDYTHSDPRGDRNTFAASPENIRRAKACLTILKAMKDVDPKRIAAYGNSMGAFLTVGLAAETRGELAAAAITAGGVALHAASAEPARNIRTPMLLLHGSTDTTVPPSRSEQLETILKAAKIDTQRKVWDGVGHNLHRDKADEVNDLLKAWLIKHGVVKRKP